MVNKGKVVMVVKVESEMVESSHGVQKGLEIDRSAHGDYDR
jgi:hypothetical protein